LYLVTFQSTTLLFKTGMRSSVFTIFLLLMILPLAVRAQALDSLKLALDRAPTDAQRILLLKKIADQLLTDRNNEAVFYYEQLALIPDVQNDKLLMSRTYSNIGTSWYYAKDLNQSSQAYYKALEFTEDVPAFYETKAKLYNNIGWNYKQFNNFEKALTLFIQAEKYARLNEAEDVLGMVLNNKGVVEKDLGKNASALNTISESLQLNRKLSNNRQERFNLNNLGVVLSRLDRNEEAGDTLRAVLAMNRAAGDTLEVVNNLINLNSIYYAEKEYALATKTLLSALTILPQHEITLRENIYKDLNQAYLAQRDHKNAHVYITKLLALRDSIGNLRYHELSLELDARYNTAVKDRDLEQANKNLAEQRLYLTFIISAFILLLLAAIFLWRLYILKKRNEKMLIVLNNEIEAQAEELHQSNENIQAINENLEALVAERTVIIKEQSQRLLQFAYINSHKIRGPIATLMGLIELLEKNNDPVFQTVLLAHLKTCSNKLDAIVREVSSKLEQEGLAIDEDSK
jgi:tetratricopeptide (TPR) repeat protein